MKFNDINVSNKIVANTLVDFVGYMSSSAITEDQLEFYADQNGAKSADEVMAAGMLVKDMMYYLASAVNKQGIEKVYEALQEMRK